MAQENKDQPDRSKVDEGLLAILVCPVCRKPVQQRDDTLLCPECGRRYPIKDGIPVMLVDEALPPEGDSPAPPR